MFKPKKGKHERDPNEEDLDLMDYDEDMFDFDDDDDGGSRTPSKRQLADEAARQAVSDGSKNVLKKSAEDLIPGDFESNVLEAKEMATYTKDLVKESADEITKSLSKVLPPKIRKILGLRDPNKPFQRSSVEEQRDGTIKGSLDKIFGSEDSNKDKLSDRNRDAALGISSLANNKLQTTVMSNMANDISKLTNFMVGIGSSYFRKSLEIQYKTYYLNLDQLNLTTKYLKAFSKQFDSMVKNTGLPDHAKITQTERIAGKFKDALAENIYKGVFSNNTIVNRIRENLKSKIQEYRDTATDAVESIGSMLEMSRDTGVSTSQLGVKLGGSAAGQWISNRLYKRVQPHLKEHLGDNETLQRIGHGTQYAVTRTGSFLQDLKSVSRRGIEENEGELGIRNRLATLAYRALGGVASLGDVGRTNLDFATTDIDSYQKPAIFDNNVYRTITDSIPMYLSRILAVNTDLTRFYTVVNSNNSRLSKLVGSGDYTPSKGLVYNYFDRKLGTKEERARAVESRITRNSTETLSSNAAALLGEASFGLANSENATKSDKFKANMLKSKNNVKLLEKYINDVSEIDGLKVDYDTIFVDIHSDKIDPKLKKYLSENTKISELLKSMSSGMGKLDGSRREGIKTTFNNKVADSKSNMPIGTISSSLAAISSIARPGEVRNKPSDKEAQAFGELIAIYMFDPDSTFQYIPNTNEDLMTMLSEMEGMRGAIDKDINKIYSIAENTLTLFINDVTIINNSGNGSSIANMKSVIAGMSEAISRSLGIMGDGDHSRLRELETVREILPDMFEGQTKLSLSQALGETLYANNLTYNTGLAPGKISKLMDNLEKDSTEALKNIADNAIFKNIERVSNVMRRAIDEEPTLIGKTKIILSTVLTEGNKLAKKTYDSVSKKAGELKDIAKNFTEKTIDEGIKQVRLKAVEVRDELTRMLAEEETLYAETLAELNDMASNISNNDPDAGSEAREQVKELNEARATRLTAIRQLTLEVESFIESLNDMDIDGASVTSKISNFITITQNKVGSLTNIMNFVNREGI